ncbi:MAG: TGS domain-containing protein [Chloroflexota bacterium]
MDHCSADISPADGHLSATVAKLLPSYTRIPIHYRRVAEQLSAWELPTHLVQTGLLMRHLERGAIHLDQLEELLGPEATEIAEALRDMHLAMPRPSQQQVEQIWRLYTLAQRHWPATILKLTSLLVYTYQSSDSNVSVQPETLSAAAYICARLGMWETRAELLNTRVRLSDPHLANRARELLQTTEPVREQFFATIKSDIYALFHSYRITAHIERRARPIYQLVDDGLERAKQTPHWIDTIMVLIENVQDCYRVLGAINQSYPVVGAQLRDYVGGPKENGYQAIHTTVQFSSETLDYPPTPVEIRIATPAMDYYNHKGFLAYLSAKVVPVRRPTPSDDYARWLRSYQQTSSEIFVFTPRGVPVFLPNNATALDFAVRVHSQLGVYCRGALVNGHRVLPSERLERGDICEVLIDQHTAPIDQRLLQAATTKTARSRIRRALQQDQTGVVRGRQIFRDTLAKQLEAYELQTSEARLEQHMTSFCQTRGYQSADAFYRAIARGETSPNQLIGEIVNSMLVAQIDFVSLPQEIRMATQQVRLAFCCQPHPPLPVVAVPTHSGKIVKIHRLDCHRVRAPLYPVEWCPIDHHVYVVDMLYESWDRPGLLHEVTTAIHQIQGLNIRTVQADIPEPGLARLRLSVEVPNKHDIEQLRLLLEGLTEQRRLELRTVALIDGEVQTSTPLDNPYSPQPVGQWPFFVGRTNEVREILTHLEQTRGARHILIRGPKRVGKSSLLEHLSRYHLNHFQVLPLLNLQRLPTQELCFPHLISRFSALIVQTLGRHAKVTALQVEDIMHDPIDAFAHFLQTIMQQHQTERFIVLIDELGTVVSRLQNNDQVREFFEQWRALLNNPQVCQCISYIVVLPDVALEQPDTDTPMSVRIWPTLRVGELGYPIRMSILDVHDASDLIITPIKNHFAYTSDDLQYLLTQTGGHPYYIHLVCSHILTAIQTQQRRTVDLSVRSKQVIPTALVYQACDVVAMNDDAFYHTLADTTSATRAVLHLIAASKKPTKGLRATQLRTRLRRLDTKYGAHTVTQALGERPDLLDTIEGDICIRVELVARWLRRHPDITHMKD